MTRGIVFLEEQSAFYLAVAVAHRLGLSEHLIFVAYEGKADLERSFARKIKAWRNPADARFVVTRDNDGGDCHALKRRLFDRIDADLHDRTKIRIVMQELESWYLGDPMALSESGLLDETQASRYSAKRKYAEPDRLTNAKQEFDKWVGHRGKIAAAQSIGPHLYEHRNCSQSFRHFIDALRWAAAER
ncbi:DUF4276 family protein [Jiella sp. MQZ9-1]|uniref:DUF4276 family protein n=1 Tax=Jiella flava TaxID=2816857 RepID=A0A939FX47_9HYPH|nr:DUF4276 family protein [Jiella flava]MBO0661780.1 DUF4276 family protein [Jiella flava]MCD2470421.1 DUF4276 family protein [Jiella flava]